ncbi:hypothetical protein M6B38_261300 [Iris pallida]|uniref:Uncharacterized protein n=1 Tax=Iris pallida TaxID=29817 RepID=A0AAX6IEH9_IRIPA|nr:hypothetical protein M6B38_261300 [Iris pallida]
MRIDTRVMLSRAIHRTKSMRRVALSQRIHRVESMQSTALSRRISALNRLEDSKKSNRPRRKSESMQVLILVGFMCRLYVYAKILEVGILHYSVRGPRNQIVALRRAETWVR